MASRSQTTKMYGQEVQKTIGWMDVHMLVCSADVEVLYHIAIVALYAAGTHACQLAS